MPLIRRIPKRGFHNQWAKRVAIVNLDDLDAAFKSGEEVTLDSLREAGLCKRPCDVLKVLGDGELTKEVEDHGPPVQRFGLGEDQEGRRRGGRAARPETGGTQEAKAKKNRAAHRPPAGRF